MASQNRGEDGEWFLGLSYNGLFWVVFSGEAGKMYLCRDVSFGKLDCEAVLHSTNLAEISRVTAHKIGSEIRTAGA